MEVLLIVFLIGFLGSLVGSFVSGTVSAITISAMLTLGIPAHSTLGIYRVGILGFRLGGLKEFLQSGNVIKSLVVPLTILGMIGAFLGSFIVISINEEVLEKVIALVILIFIPLTLLNKKLGLVKQQVTKTKKRLGFVSFLFISIWAASFAVGTGIFATYMYLYLFGTTLSR